MYLQRKSFKSSNYKFEKKRTLGHFFFRSSQTLCSDCVLTISDIAKRFFPSNRKTNCKETGRSTFLDFVTWLAEESDKVENYRFLENCSMELAENQQKKSVFNILSSPIIKNFKIGSENLRIFFDFSCADRQNFQKNGFFQILIFTLLIISAEKVSKSDHAA